MPAAKQKIQEVYSGEASSVQQAAPEDLNSQVRARTRALSPELVALRRDIHRHPELGFAEKRTTGLVASGLRSLGLEPHALEPSGVVCDLRGDAPAAGGRAGGGAASGAAGPGVPGPFPSVVFRADMDALPIQDQKEVDYASSVPGVMHACGHDGHVAMLLGAARVLAGLRGRLRGRVRFLFQPAEEKIPGGAARMIEQGCLDGAQAVLGLHLWTQMPAGQIWADPGPLMAAVDEIRVSVEGRGGHAALPHQAVDALVAAAQTVVALQTVVSRRVDPLEPAVLTLGTFRAGYAFNVIADRADMEGTVRTLSPQLRARMRGMIEQVVEGTCRASGAAGKVEYLQGYPPVVADPAVVDVVRRACAGVVGPQNLISLRPVMGGEDFSLYLERVPGAFVFLGAGQVPGKDYPHHHPRFDFDEDALALGVEVWCRCALELLGWA